jgi:hypothetical protein
MKRLMKMRVVVDTSPPPINGEIERTGRGRILSTRIPPINGFSCKPQTDLNSHLTESYMHSLIEKTWVN